MMTGVKPRRWCVAVVIALAMMRVLDAQTVMHKGISKPKPGDKYEFAFWAPAKSVVRSEAMQDGTILQTVAAPTVFRVFAVYSGWLHVRSLDDSIEGWIVQDSQDQEKSRFVPRDPNIAMLLIVGGHNVGRSDAVILDILHKRARIGFSRSDVLSALGDPRRQVDEETASGKTETLFYTDQVVVVTNGKVTKITTVNKN